MNETNWNINSVCCGDAHLAETGDLWVWTHPSLQSEFHASQGYPERLCLKTKETQGLLSRKQSKDHCEREKKNTKLQLQLWVKEQGWRERR